MADGKFTQRVEMLLGEAHSLVLSSNHSSIEPAHILLAMLNYEQSLLVKAINRLRDGGDSLEGLRGRARGVVEDLPRLANPPGDIGLGASAAKNHQQGQCIGPRVQRRLRCGRLAAASDA